MKRIGEDTYLSTIESIGAVVAFVVAVFVLIFAFPWATRA